MALEGIQQLNNQQFIKKPTTQNVSVPKEVQMPGAVKDVSIGGLSTYVAAGLAEIKKNLEKKLRRTGKKISSGLMSMLGIEGEEGDEEAGGMDTIKKGLKEIFKNLRQKRGSDEG